MRYSLYLPPSPGDVMSLRMDTPNLAAGTIVTIEEIVYKEGVTYTLSDGIIVKISEG